MTGVVDFAFELAGSAKALETAYGSVRPGGAVIVAGLAPQDARFELSLSETVCFDGMTEGFDRLSAGRTLRQILLPHGRA